MQAGTHSRLKLLTLWSDIATTGKSSLYSQLFLTRSVLKTDPVFDHPLGQYLQYFDADAVDHTYKPFHCGFRPSRRIERLEMFPSSRICSRFKAH